MDPFVIWCLIVGLLLITIGLTDTWRQELPVCASAIYLLAGYLLGPEVSGLLNLRLDTNPVLLERLAEGAVLISLFAVGLRLRARLRDPLWHTPLVLATVAMVLTVGLMTGLGLTLGLSLGSALLLAAVLAPTDPVLASEVQVEHAADRDRLRFSLTGEGGLNDGTAFPFVMLALGLLGLHELGDGAWRWWSVDVVWAVSGGVAIGWALGFAFSHAVVYLRREREQALGMESFLTLGLIALAYGAAIAVQAYGFLAVFFAGLAMRQVERRDNPRARPLDVPPDAPPAQASAYMAKAVLDFTLDLEKLAELTVMLLVGSLITRAAFTPATLAVAFGLMFVVRPIAVYASTMSLPLTATQRRLAAWFGVRGVGSMYYLAYAVAKGAAGEQTAFIIDAVLVTIVMSVLLHGSTATPVMRLYRRARRPR
ncbi:cation:proton antiporter [Piscinibacter gummiphilus]|uniref:Cation:proton antiporter n=1 Tax=Piscinibacter gummiphilus TaxID=946333 RepID=A0ABZ0CVR0_9BURK|nr:cation:proton antiporter [Piscinibacter gummiphilus]WOB07226.1 cation:proton antiporter [Piscinibacter gummiphilus]